MEKKVRILILAGGKGNRMQSELPKVLIKIQGECIIEHILSSVKKSGVDEKPIIVVGYGKEAVMDQLGSGYEYAIQEKQLGTGHAVITAEKNLKGNADHVVVLYGDHPFITPETIQKLVEKHIDSAAKITMATVKLADFKDWRSVFYSNFSRIIRDGSGNIIKDIQFKDANDEEKTEKKRKKRKR
mgnify:FL=1